MDSNAVLVDVTRFMYAGNASFTVVSNATGVRFTFKVRAKEVEGGTTLHFVSVLTGSDNESDYTFLGTIFNRSNFRHGARSSIGVNAPSAKAFAWFFRNVAGGGMLQGATVHHEGRCGRCGRKLTVPESIQTGLGPECAGKAA